MFLNCIRMEWLHIILVLALLPYCRLNCVPPYIYMLKPWPSVWCYLGLGLWNLIRFRWADDHGALRVWSVPLPEEKLESLFLLFLPIRTCKNATSRWLSSSQKDITRNQLSWHLSLEPLAPRIVRKDISVS